MPTEPAPESHRFIRHAERYAPAYLRAGLYATMIGLLSFNETFEKLTAEQIGALTSFQVLCLWFKPLIAIIGAVVAFLDQTLARINADRKEEREERSKTAAPFPSRLEPRQD
jgi:hypothetical protein